MRNLSALSLLTHYGHLFRPQTNTPTMTDFTKSSGHDDLVAPLTIDTLLRSHSSGNSSPAGSNEFDSQIKMNEPSRAPAKDPSESEPIFPVFIATASHVKLKAFAPSANVAGKLMDTPAAKSSPDCSTRAAT
jgi:hypothetical protein